MKRTLLLTAFAATLFCNPASAQITKLSKALPEVDLGVKLGANMQQLSGDYWKNSYKTGIFGGVFVGVHKGKMGVQVEALVKQVTYDFSISSATTSKVKAVYLDVPVLFEYKIIPRLWLQIGPQFSAMLSAKTDNSTDVKNSFKSSDISGVAGLDVRLPFRLSAGARYVLGFTDINNDLTPAATATGAWKNRSIQLYLGFRFL